jgi:hypothetical protein
MRSIAASLVLVLFTAEAPTLVPFVGPECLRQLGHVTGDALDPGNRSYWVNIKTAPC